MKLFKKVNLQPETDLFNEMAVMCLAALLVLRQIKPDQHVETRISKTQNHPNILYSELHSYGISKAQTIPSLDHYIGF